MVANLLAKLKSHRLAGHPSAQFSTTLRVHLDNRPGSFASVAATIGDAGGLLDAIDLVRVEDDKKVRDITVLAPRRGPRRGDRRGRRLPRGRRGRARLRPDVPDAPRRQARGRPEDAVEDARRPLDGVHARRRRASRRRSPPTPRRPGRSRSSRTPSRSSPTARRCSGSATSAPRPRCPSWKARPCSSRSSAASTPFRSAWTRRILDEIVRIVDRDRARFRRDQPRGHLGAPLLRDRAAAAGDARHSGLPRRPARNRDRRPRSAIERAPGRRQADRGRARRRHWRRRGRHRGDEDPAGRGRHGHRRLRQPRASSSAARTDLSRRQGVSSPT